MKILRVHSLILSLSQSLLRLDFLCECHIKNLFVTLRHKKMEMILKGKHAETMVERKSQKAFKGWMRVYLYNVSSKVSY